MGATRAWDRRGSAVEAVEAVESLVAGGWRRTADVRERIDVVASRDELRVALRRELVAGEALWLWSEGLTLGAPRAQARLLRMVGPHRRGQREEGRPLGAVVVDWSDATMPGADQLAMFAVLGATAAARGAVVVACTPLDAASAFLFTGDSASTPRRWVQSTSPRRRGRWWQPARGLPVPPPQRMPLAPVTCVAGLGRRALASFGDTLAAGVGRLGGTAREIELVSSAVMEIGQNVLRHAAGSAALAATVRTDRGAVVELAAADAGPGIARTLATRLGVDLSGVPERHFVRQVFHGAITGEREEPGGGRGMARLTRILVHDAGGRVTVRSGGARVVITGRGEQIDVVASVSCGLGTQLLIELPLGGPFGD